MKPDVPDVSAEARGYYSTPCGCSPSAVDSITQTRPFVLAVCRFCGHSNTSEVTKTERCLTSGDDVTFVMQRYSPG